MFNWYWGCKIKFLIEIGLQKSIKFLNEIEVVKFKFLNEIEVVKLNFNCDCKMN